MKPRSARKPAKVDAPWPRQPPPRRRSVAPLDPEAIKAAITEANAPLLERIAAQDKTLRKQRKAIDAIASQPDTSQAPLRGVAAVNKTSAPRRVPLERSQVRGAGSGRATRAACKTSGATALTRALREAAYGPSRATGTHPDDTRRRHKPRRA